jgi:hypothetical protein
VRTEDGPSEALWYAYQSWRTAASPLADYVAVTPFLAPWTPVARPPVHPSTTPLVQRTVERLAVNGQDRTALFLEAPPRLGLSAGRRLRAAGWTVVPLFARWPAPQAVLPVERLAGWLLACALEWSGRSAPRGRADEKPPREVEARATAAPGALRICLLLDAERARTVPPHTLRRRFDNRYEYGAYTLPPGERLREWGVTRVLWLGPAAMPALDLDVYASAVTAAGITLDLVSLRSQLR